MSTKKDKRKVNKRSGSFLLDPSSSLYSGDKTTSSFLGGEGTEGMCSFAESTDDVKSTVKSWILKSTAFNDAMVDLFDYNEEAQLAKDEIDEIIKSAIEDGIRDYKQNSENPLSITFEEEQELVDELAPEAIRMYKNEYNIATDKGAALEANLSTLQKLMNSTEDAVTESSEFTDDLGDEYSRVKELESWTDPEGEVHKLFVAYHKDTDEPKWFITYGEYNDIDWEEDSEETAYEWFEGMKKDYFSEYDDNGIDTRTGKPFGTHYDPDDADEDFDTSDLLDDSIIKEDQSDDEEEEELSSPERMKASWDYFKSHENDINNDYVKISSEFDTFHDIISITIDYEIPQYPDDDSVRDIKNIPCRFELGRKGNDQYCYDGYGHKEEWDTGVYIYEEPEILFDLIQDEAEKISDILHDFEENPEDHMNSDHPDWKPHDRWEDAGMTWRDFMSDSVHRPSNYGLMKVEEGYKVIYRCPKISTVVTLSDSDIIKLNESTHIISKKVITKSDRCYKIVEGFYKTKVGGKV